MKYCKIVLCPNSRGSSDIHMFRLPRGLARQQEWNEALENVECTNGSLICINHFDPSCYDIKLDKILPKLTALPTIFPTPKEKTVEETRTENRAATVNAEKEIQFLREYVAGQEREYELTSERLQMKIDAKDLEISLLKEKVCRLEEANSKFETDFAAFAVDDDEKIQEQKEILTCLALGIRHRESYSPAVRNFAISLKNISPVAYRFVRNVFNNHLPHSNTIIDWHANSDINCEHGIMEHSLNILRRRATEMAEKGQKLRGAALFDEVSIKQNIQFANNEMLGFENYPGIDRSIADVATEALVFMFSAINDDIRLPVAYYFVTKKIDAATKMIITEKIIEKLLECGVEVECLVFDGLYTNPAMCRLLGTNLDVFSNTFKTSFEVKGKNIYVLFDFSHVIKLVRNNLGSKKVFIDGENNEIKWSYIEKLVQFKDKRNFALCHKLTQAHIDYSANPMKVRLACETFSASTAASIEFLMNQGHAEFAGAEGTIQFIRKINDLFDVFNSTKNDVEKDNPLKNQMSPRNAQQIFQLFIEGSEYLKGLQMVEDSKRIKICKSSVKIGFQGFVINIQSLTEIYNKLVVDEKAVDSIATHSMSQDHLEIFFGKIRALNGYNNNPTCQQFTAAMRKLMANTAILYSKGGNCSDLGPVFSYNPYSNISSVSSLRPAKNSTGINENIEEYICEDEEVESLLSQLADIQSLERENTSTDLENLTVAQIAGRIEWTILNSNRFDCEHCKSVLINSTKLRQAFLTSSQTIKPCQSTFDVCTVADHFLKIEILKGQFSMATIERAIISSLDFENLYTDDDFLQHADHKLYMIKHILKQFIRIKGTHLARTYNSKNNQKLMRQKLTKLILHYHQ